MSDTSHRLPEDVRPHRYDLVLEPDLDAATFAGQVIIAIQVQRPTDTVVLHAAAYAVTALGSWRNRGMGTVTIRPATPLDRFEQRCQGVVS